MKKITTIAALLCAFSLSASADESLSVSAGYNQQGCVDAMGVESTVAVSASYERIEDSFDLAAYVRRAPRGADCREDGVTIDLDVERQFPLASGAFVNVELGYKQHGVTAIDAMNVQIFGTVKQSIAALGVGRQFGNVEVDAGWNIPTAQPKVAVEATFDNLRLAADRVGDFSTAAVIYTVDLDTNWALRFELRNSIGFDSLPDPFGGRADAPATNESSTFEIGIEWSP